MCRLAWFYTGGKVEYFLVPEGEVISYTTQKSNVQASMVEEDPMWPSWSYSCKSGWELG